MKAPGRTFIPPKAKDSGRYEQPSITFIMLIIVLVSAGHCNSARDKEQYYEELSL